MKLTDEYLEMGEDEKRCPDCDGWGFVPYETAKPGKAEAVLVPHGTFPRPTCPACDGTGKVKK